MLQKSETGLPVDWRERIDGKKVFLYNTNVGTLLSGREKHIQKMNWVFDEFKRNPDVVLWWRPHPLELTTVESMRPDLKKDYLNTRGRFVNDNIGILDVSADLHRAIAVSDAYYGDGSSLVQLYNVTGKPILINIDDIIPIEDIKITTMDLFLYKDKIWFTAWNFNLLFNIDIHKKKIEIVGPIPGEGNFMTCMSNIIVAEQDWLVIVPASGNKIIRYDIKKKVFDACISEVKGEFIGCVKKDAMCYLIPTYTGEIVKYNAASNIVEKRVSLEKKYHKAGYRKNVILDGDFFYYILEKSNEIGKYDTRSDSIEYIRVGEEKSIICSLTKYKDCFYIVTGECVFITKGNSWDIEDSIEFPHNFISGDYPFIDVVNKSHMLYLIPYSANMLLRINLDKRIIDTIQVNNSNVGCYNCGCLTEEGMYVGKSAGGIEYIDLTHNQARTETLGLESGENNIEKELFHKMQKDECLMKSFQMIENDVFNIRRYIKYIRDGKLSVMQNEKDGLSSRICGPAIYKACKE